MVEHTDVVVVGGGPAGLGTAIELAGLGCEVAVIDAAVGRASSLGEHLSPAARPVLEHFGVWEQFSNGPNVPCYARLSAWGDPELNEVSSIQSPYGAGWLIDRNALEHLLRQRARHLGVSICHARVITSHRRGARWRLRVNADHATEATIVIDATGRRCSIVRSTGGSVHAVDRLVAVSSRFSPARTPVPAPLLIESVPNGWWYSAEGPGGALVAVLVTEPAVVAHEGASAAWHDGLAAAPHTRVRVAPRRTIGPLTTHAAGVQRATSPLDTSCIAVGDAALAVDPLSGSGLRMALESSRLAAHAAASLLRGDSEPAAAYARELDDRLASHLAQRATFYGLEKRWPGASFWATRTACSVIPFDVKTKTATKSPAVTRRDGVIRGG